MAITAWSAKVCSSAICRSVKGPARDPRDRMAPIARLLAAAAPQRGVGVDGLRHVADRVVGIRVDVGYLHGLAARHRAAVPPRPGGIG